MKILIINDDGYNAPGLVALVQALADQHELYVCAPREHMSGMGHAITVTRAIDVEKFEMPGTVEAYKVNGTPSDCAKIACLYLYKDIAFDLVLSGINDGANLGHDIIYSGTVSAAHEAYRYENHAIALSVSNQDRATPNDFSYAAAHIRDFIPNINYDIDKFLYNINYPYMQAPKALKYALPSIVDYREKIDVEGERPNFKIRFTGTALNASLEDDNDFALLDAGYATLVPVRLSVKEALLDHNIKQLIED